MAQVMKENTIRVKNKAREFSHGLMGAYSPENLRIMIFTEMEFISGLTDECSKVLG